MILQQWHTNRIPGEKIAPAQSIANPPFIVPETHPSTRSLPQSHNPLSSLFIFIQCVRVIYSQVSFLWVITLGRGVSGLTQFLGLASLVFHLAIISSNRGPSHWYASYALAGHAASASLPLLVGRSLGSISGDGNGMYSFRRQLLALAVQATPALVWFPWTGSSFYDAGVQRGNGS